MILLSENNDYKYYAVEVPVNSHHISKVYVMDDNDPTLYYSETEDRQGDETWLSIENDFEIIGVLGKGEEIPEEESKEIISAAVYSKLHDGADIGFLLKTLLHSKGILIENPIPEPKRSVVRYTDSFEFGWRRHYESKLVKAVIIKVKQ